MNARGGILAEIPITVIVTVSALRQSHHQQLSRQKMIVSDHLRKYSMIFGASGGKRFNERDRRGGSRLVVLRIISRKLNQF